MLEKYCSFNGEDQGVQACIDEVGRGSWAGRVYVAAVIWNYEVEDDYTRMIKDSKKLSPKMRELLSSYIMDHAIDYSVTFLEPEEIDEMNILNATMTGMHQALDTLDVCFDTIIVDGNQFRKYKDIPHKCIVGGDNKYIGIACASILAKVEHDKHMEELAIKCPHYDWQNNMGYGSASHSDALKKFGVSKYHRLSYNPMKTMLSKESIPEEEPSDSL
jgi:ribonuclease HII